MELTITQKIIGGIIIVALAGLAVSMALNDLKNSKITNDNQNIEKSVIDEPATK
ncbi:MAG: hypothetical protein HQL70_01170 [Magnetococcales bacterium]|nr:hypothetical protein [Magnetococcales bacterium]